MGAGTKWKVKFRPRMLTSRKVGHNSGEGTRTTIRYSSVTAVVREDRIQMVGECLLYEKETETYE